MAPAFVLIGLIAIASGAVAHVLWGHHWRQIPLFVLVAFVGGTLMYVLGWRLPLDLPAPAGVHLLEVTLVAWGLIIAVSRLSR